MEPKINLLGIYKIKSIFLPFPDDRALVTVFAMLKNYYLFHKRKRRFKNIYAWQSENSKSTFQNFEFRMKAMDLAFKCMIFRVRAPLYFWYARLGVILFYDQG